MRQGKDTYLGGSDPIVCGFQRPHFVGSLPPASAVNRAACLCPVATEREEIRKKLVPIMNRTVGAE